MLCDFFLSSCVLICRASQLQERNPPHANATSAANPARSTADFSPGDSSRLNPGDIPHGGAHVLGDANCGRVQSATVDPTAAVLSTASAGYIPAAKSLPGAIHHSPLPAPIAEIPPVGSQSPVTLTGEAQAPQRRSHFAIGGVLVRSPFNGPVKRPSQRPRGLSSPAMKGRAVPGMDTVTRLQQMLPGLRLVGADTADVQVSRA